MRERGLPAAKGIQFFATKTQRRKGIAAQWNTDNTLRPEVNERKRVYLRQRGIQFFATKTQRRKGIAAQWEYR